MYFPYSIVSHFYSDYNDLTVLRTQTQVDVEQVNVIQWVDYGESEYSDLFVWRTRLNKSLSWYVSKNVWVFFF